MPTSWTEREVQAIVEDYFDMFLLEISGRAFNKSEHRREILERLDDRSGPSVEFKHCNISAALRDMGYPFIAGYKPRSNYQRTLLPIAIQSYLAEHPEIDCLVSEDVVAPADEPSVVDILSLLEGPPELDQRPRQVREPGAAYGGGPVDYVAREAANQSLGLAGERFVLNFERARLIHAGQDRLADTIEHVSVTRGDAAGFDIRSYNDDGSDRFIEVKTTRYNKYTPFFLTANELQFAQDHSTHYRLCRPFSFRRQPRLFELPGSPADFCRIEPTEYRASFVA